MYPIWLLCLSNLKRRKIQNGFIALIMLLASLLFSTAVIVITNTNNSYMDFHTKVQGSHQILKLEQDLHNPNQVESWWGSQQGVQSSGLLRYRSMTGYTFNGKDYPNTDLMMMDTPAQPVTVDRLVFAEGTQQAEPEEGTVWLPTSIAYPKGIGVGDTIEFKKDTRTMSMKVAAVVIDVAYSSPFTSTGRVWMNHADFQSNLLSMQGKDMFMLALRFDHYEENATYWRSFERELGTPYLESVTKFESLSSFYTVTNKMLGFVIIFLALMMILVALYTVGFTISDAVLSSYKTIGILKSQGFTSYRTTGIYVLQYTVLSVISIIPGIALSYPFSKFIIAQSLAYLRSGDASFSIQYFGAAAAVGASILVVVIVISWLFSYRTRFIQPVQAIRYGMSERSAAKQQSNWLISFSRLPIVWVLGLRGVLKNRAGSILMTLMAVATSAVLIFCSIFIYSIVSINKTISSWGYDSSDISMRIDEPKELSNEQLNQTLFRDSRIVNHSRFGDTNGVIPFEDDTGTNQLNVVLTLVDGNYDEIGVSNLRGGNPHADDEISIGINVAKQLKKDVGDKIDVYVLGDKKSMTITGVYQAIANLAYSARMKAAAIPNSQRHVINMDSYFVNLQDNINPDTFVTELNNSYGSALWSATHESLVNEVFSAAVAGLVLPMSVIGLLFLLATFVIIFSICRINIRKEQKNYGIYKSIGMTSRKIRVSISSGVFNLSMIGAIIGIPVGLFLLPRLLNVILANYGIVEMPLSIQAEQVVLGAILSVAAATLGSWLASKTVKSMSPRILTVD
ncbi:MULTISPECIES: ABC transporter permease [Paenibacillus]|uniref:FtsX-like permease family protein n=2 Tax=Paenibacillus alvei TaxID=44250 RepID=A0ABT4EBX7_PAEAL|nr:MULTISPECIES: FtsX-like permease family protein [Paenibacillus]EPY13699.1 hypothetical protein PAAL66ix_06718 [Paenibacillus alvei A6-6i-x]MCY9530153.1 FtsX-like permease family protein [Paenibacillus alvei]SDF63920.1 putative ABC transport system permease protein [Paenibacillus sp. cl6col]